MVTCAYLHQVRSCACCVVLMGYILLISMQASFSLCNYGQKEKYYLEKRIKVLIFQSSC